MNQFLAGHGNLFFGKKAQKVPPLRLIFLKETFFGAANGPFLEAILGSIFAMTWDFSFLEKGSKHTPVEADFAAGCIFGSCTGTDFWPLRSTAGNTHKIQITKNFRSWISELADGNPHKIQRTENFRSWISELGGGLYNHFVNNKLDL